MHRLSSYMAAFCFVLLSVPALAQSPSGRAQSPGGAKQGQKAPAGTGERTDPLARERRATALMLAASLADEARSYHDEQLRARVLARTADALWESETERARALFRRAWEAAETADRESLKRYEEQRQANGGRRPGVDGRSEVRAEVLRLAARRDRALGEEFLEKAAESADDTATTASPGSTQSSLEVTTPDPEQPPAAVAGRLNLARQFLEEGDVDRALQFADKGLDRVTTFGVLFLSMLREKNQAAADQRFASLLSRTANDPTADATHVSVLSSYVFTPFLYVIARRDGRNHTSQMRDRIAAPSISNELRAAFMRTAAQILLRPLPTPDQDRTLAGRPGLYLTIARLLPLFDQYAADFSPELRAQLSALSPDAPEDFRNGQSSMLTRGLVPEETMRDEGQSALEKAERAQSGDERDLLYAEAALNAAHKGDARARDYVDKIENSDIRKQARAYVDFTMFGRALEKKDATEALRLARTGELTNVQRAWALVQTAQLLIKPDPTRAAEILNEALTEARRIGGSDADRPRALIGVATRFYELNHDRAWEVMSEALKAANSVSEFTGEDAQIVSRFVHRNSSWTSNFSVDFFDLNRIFTLLSADDLSRAVELAKGFTGEAPRAVATLAIVRAALGQKQGERRVSSDRQVTNE